MVNLCLVDNCPESISFFKQIIESMELHFCGVYDSLQDALEIYNNEIDIIFIDPFILTEDEYNYFKTKTLLNKNIHIYIYSTKSKDQKIEHEILELLNLGAINIIEKNNIEINCINKFILKSCRIINLFERPQRKIIDTSKIKKERKSQIIGLGISTGGPDALLKLFSKIKIELSVPFVIVIHLNNNFMQDLIDSLNKKTKFNFVIAQHDTILKAGTIYIAPGNKHLKFSAHNKVNKIVLSDDPPDNFCKPSVNYLFKSMADIFGESATAIIMTGAGDDGLVGLKSIKERKGIIIAQNKKSCSVYSMSKNAIDLSLADFEYSIEEIAFHLNNTNFVN